MLVNNQPDPSENGLYIASDIQSISNVAKKPEYKNESFSADLIAEWMDEIQERIQTQLNNVIENS